MTQWTIIGAGPAGIASIGKLLDAGIAAKDISWIDPAFKVGDFGEKWANVDSNTKVKYFTQFLAHCEAFKLDTSQFELFSLNPEHTCKLNAMGDCLQVISDRLQETVQIKKGRVSHLLPNGGNWSIEVDDDILQSSNVILAFGSEPNQALYDHIPTIDMVTALDADKLANEISCDDVIAVFGSSHSAIMIIRDAIAAGAKKVINFYRSPLRYALEMDNWILFDNTGLKGKTAQWAKQHIQKQPHPKLERYYSDDDTVSTYLPQCTKAIYATGFHRRTLTVPGCEGLDYNDKTGIIAPGLFGVGIAFPEGKTDPLGNFELNVGLWKFMVYLDRVLPLWLRYNF